MPPDGPWVSATEMAEYAYCPRARYYHDHPPAAGSTPAGDRRAAAGQRYHARELGRERRRSEHPVAYWGLLGIGVVLALGGLAWLLFR